jgi:thioredoxin reductase (NADPH)
MDTLYDLIIVGAGPAGLTAAIYAIRANLKTLLLDRLSPGGQMVNSDEIENYPGVGKITGAELAIKMFKQAQELGVEFDYKTVLAITDEGRRKVIACEEEGAVYQTRTVILATGTVPRTLGVPGESRFAGRGISWCAICDGARYRGKDVVVIGGGNSAVQEAQYLAAMCNKVTIVTMLDLTADAKACDRLRAFPNVAIYTYQEVLEFTGTDELDGVTFKATKEGGEQRHVLCSGVFEYIGFQASNNAFANLPIVDNTGCIQVDSHMQTSVPGVFGAGDITNKYMRQIATAVSDGAVAAHSAAAYIQSLS